jgi:hypothetical protein
MYSPSEYSSWRLTPQTDKQFSSLPPQTQTHKSYFCVHKRWSSSSSSSNGRISSSSSSNSTGIGMSSSGISIIMDTTNRTNSSSDN